MNIITAEEARNQYIDEIYGSICLTVDYVMKNIANAIKRHIKYVGFYAESTDSEHFDIIITKEFKEYMEYLGYTYIYSSCFNKLGDCSSVRISW